jgi:hypothetical protein
MVAMNFSLSRTFRPVAVASAVLFAMPAFAATGSGPDLLARNWTKAAECSCSGKSDCTCKKGACKCAKCGKGNRVRVMDTLKANPDPAKLPDTARYDATGGVLL